MVVFTDIFSKKKRSEIMSKIKGSRTGIEIKLGRALRTAELKGFRYQPKMREHPDFVFERHKIAIFCDGSFWHGYQFDKWSRKLSPFWLKKISSNIVRDKKVTRKLRGSGWKVLRFWDWEIEGRLDKVMRKIAISVGERNE